MADKIQRMKEISGILTEAGKAYYQEDREIMSNYEYDKLYDELESLEKETGIVLTGSPTTRVGYESVDELPKERHEAPMLSLDKTKNREDLKTFAGSQKVLVSWKLDGLTVVLTYRKRPARQSSNKRKRGSGRGHYQQCQSVSEHSPVHSLYGRAGAARGSGDFL